MTDAMPRWPVPMGYPPAGPARTRMSPTMRAASADRERTVDVLKAAFTEGRLTQDEYDERMGAAYQSRTYGELEALVADLPAGPYPFAVQPMAVPGPVWQAAPSTESNSMAIASLVLGLAEFATFGITAIPAIICGHVARAQMRRTGQRGDGMAVAGLALGYAAVALFVIGLIAVGLIAARNSGTAGTGQSAP
jgi:hypothetical protein